MQEIETLRDQVPGLCPAKHPTSIGAEWMASRTIQQDRVAGSRQPSGAEAQTEHMRTSTAPCVKCGFVYPWQGTTEEVSAILESVGWQCPACYNNLPSPNNRHGLAVSATRKGTRRRAQYGRMNI